MATTNKFKEGDRVKHADVTAASIPAYRAMRGTVVGFDWTRVLVKWDCDKGFPPTSVGPEEITHEEDPCRFSR